MIRKPQYQDDVFYVTGSERRIARTPRRSGTPRRHRVRFESDLTDCRSSQPRRKEDEEGFYEFETLYSEK